jgi:hypothetical protein
MLTRITPGMLWAGLVISAAAAAIFRTIERNDPGDRMAALWSGGTSQMLHLVAYVLVLLFCLKIRSDYPAPSAMRLAWVLMACCAAVSMVRHAFEFIAVLAGWIPGRVSTVVGFRQIPIALSLLFLTGGLVAMWSSFAAIGLGMRFRASDLFTAAAILGLVPWVLSTRSTLNDSSSVYPLIRVLQAASPVLLAAPALVGLALHRISVEMGGGQLALSLRYLVVFLVFRLAALLVQFSPAIGTWPLSAEVAQALFAAATWLFVLAVASRWHLTISADQLSTRYETDPAAEIARLAGRPIR